MRKQYLQVITLILALFFTACSDAWESHKEVASDTPSKSIMELLKGNSEFSVFVSALEQTGYDKNLSSSQFYTVWALTNDVIGTLPTDVDELKLFIGQHINVGETKIGNLSSITRLKMLSGKVLEVSPASQSIDGIALIAGKADQVAKNGVIQVLAGPIVPKITIWDYINQVAPANQHVDYLKSLSGEVFDPEIADIIGYTPGGKPIYDTLSGMVWKNSFLEDVADLRVEDSTYTFFIVDDAVITSEFTKFSPYFKVGSGSSPNEILLNKEKCMYKITKDYVITQTYSIDELPSIVYSPDGVKVPVDKSAITSSFKASNGWVYHLSACDIAKADKIMPIKVEGESPDRFVTNYTIFGSAYIGTPAGYQRKRDFASGGYDYIVDNHATSNTASGLILYAGEVASVKYNFYWKAIHDFRGSYKNPKAVNYILRQKVGFTTLLAYHGGKPDFSPASFVGDYVEVPDSVTYETAPVMLGGSFKFTSMKDIYLWLQTQENGSSVVADYLLLVPDFN